jgi:3-methylcrotonyl-CoA carboxylase alpha subunit
MPAGDSGLFERILIANRGEIAVRVIRACADLGIRSIAVYSDADLDALHTRMADEAHRLGPGPAHQSYLSIPRVVEVARASGAQAIHPGYGFLSENAAFAEACHEAGLTFIGPSPQAMRLLGDKAAARRLAAEQGVPVVPGYDGPDQQDDVLAAEAARIGYPLLVKAAAGGGGRGMRAVHDAADLPEALASARREAAAAFGDDTLILERLVVGARHVEVQVLGDLLGSLIHLGERDCSVQRRHQKVIEESPSPGLSPELRRALGEAAIRVARAAGYSNAGTCEFLVDGGGGFWFIEMNARLQVEHPVTELVTGLDLVRAQIEIAAGRPVPWRQDQIELRGHAIECRLYAEDPDRDDLPSPGRLVRFQPPDGAGLRNDVGYTSGDVVPPFYDTMLGKLIACGDDRESALGRARAALDRYVVEGVPTNRALLAWILDNPAFRAGGVTTEFLAASRPSAAVHEVRSDEALAAAVAWHLATPESSSGALGDWRLGGQGILTSWLVGDAPARVAVLAHRQRRHAWEVVVGERRMFAVVANVEAGEVSVRSVGSMRSGADAVFRFRVALASDGLTVHRDKDQVTIRRAPSPDVNSPRAARASEAASVIQAPLPGRIVKVATVVGATVVRNQPLVVVEAMKIETSLGAPRDGVVAAVHCAVGDAVAGGQLLVELAP